MIVRIIFISLILCCFFGCESPLKPELISVNGKKYEEIIDPIVNHPKLLTPIDSLRSNFLQEAKALEFKGQVFVQIKVDSVGRVQDPKIIKGDIDNVNQIAIEIIKTAKFEPALQNGKPVSVEYMIPFISN
ncbi:MAG: energy transducer TonB [Balneola sp.]|jgi:protein TonB